MFLVKFYQRLWNRLFFAQIITSNQCYNNGQNMSSSNITYYNFGQNLKSVRRIKTMFWLFSISTFPEPQRVQNHNLFIGIKPTGWVIFWELICIVCNVYYLFDILSAMIRDKISYWYLQNIASLHFTLHWRANWTFQEERERERKRVISD